MCADRSRHPIVHLVGSIPLPDSEIVFRTLSSAVGPHLKRVPDGETGIRKTWIRLLQEVLAQNPAIEVASDVPPFKFVQWDGKLLREIPRLVTALVFAALWYALGIRPLRFAGGPELYNTNAKPTDALANMRDSYADLTRPRPAPSPPQAVPQLGPPLPGDLGRPMLQQQIGTQRLPPIPRRSGAGASGNRQQYPWCSSPSRQDRPPFSGQPRVKQQKVALQRPR